ncbi:EFR1 family ferrodoxin [Anaerocolumna sp. MB42-C2]|uniref:EFR1 family ferrodoxin n=1 Tax=Anaerocolumna sp. MB42-C2 TaxID=3070997 RepID=UPI0027E0C4C0|nr:EFR1 family ferrodoxin [Anaerocolumna sp. MB42-C2]WMJ90301.1 EFR1 family ferrodoxin [Anaerocolumna sp. MB42-C2]
MIFYFSGTGNSLFIAKNIAEHSNERLISIAAVINSGISNYEYTLKVNELVGFVCPIYAWGPPKPLLDFINKLKLNHYNRNYVFAVVTCGSNIGNTMKIFHTCLKNKNISLNSGYSVIMPSNYILMGDVDSKKIEKEKLSEADSTLQLINESIHQRKNEFQVEKGRFPWLLSGIINPVFSKNASNTSKFYANDQCCGCGICEKVCNCRNIKVNKKPKWGQQCTQCLACINYCPAKAIQYGKATENKGRYTNPNISTNEFIQLQSQVI